MRWCWDRLLLAVMYFVLPCTSTGDYSSPRMLCPMGYWPAMVNINGGQYETDRTFELPFMHDAEDPICQFCPNVGCFIVRRTVTKSADSTGGFGSTTPSTSAPETMNPTTPNIIMTTVSADGSEGEMVDTTPETGSLVGGDTENEPDYKLFMSCNHWTSLPSPTEIVSYLDCVMIGKKDEFYLFIYEPRFRSNPLPTVDCVDANFLQWIPNGTQLLGLELGFRMKSIPPFLFRYHQRIMLLTQYICIDGSSLTNKSIPFEDTERFASNKLTQVVFRTDSLRRDRRPPKAPDSQYTTEFQSDEEISACPHIVQHQSANITPTTDCQFSPSALPTTSDRVDPLRAKERCHFKSQISKRRVRRRKPHTGLLEELRVPSSVLSACLLIIVLLLIFGIIIAFCVMNADKLMICKTRSRKRKEREAQLASELAEQAAKEAAAALAAADAESRQPMAWHPIYGRYGMVPPTMGGAFGVFAARTLEVPANQPGGMGAMQTVNPTTMPRPGPGPGYTRPTSGIM
ncbi:hypothetical protein FGIG_04393 [Fasciola gigantica]|uniref:Uncharacterized protein n=1 Tax=Fasciola gigantica TaxID=46835 RepID=A0A504YKP2_FASGI|nr:hypothetical protein FGIG_04393 [Fasciola gigantica]